MFAIRATISSSCWDHAIPKFKKIQKKLKVGCGQICYNGQKINQSQDWQKVCGVVFEILNLNR